MSSVYFVKTKTHYDPYRDFFRLAELSGYPVIYIDEMDTQDASKTYIFTPLNGETSNGWADAKAQIVLFDLEWRIGESSYEWAENLLVIPPGVKRVWASDKWYAGKIGAEYVPLGSHAGLVGDAVLNGDGYDVALLAYLSGRRQHAAAELQARGMKLAPNAWNPERDAMLKSTTAMIHVHQHDNVPTIAPLRFALAAAYRLPLISERVYEADLYRDAVLFVDYHALPDYTAALVRHSPTLLKTWGAALHDRLCVSNSFRSFVEAAL